MINLSPFFLDIYHFSKPLMSLFCDFARQGWWCLGNCDVPKLFLACFPLSTLIFVKKQIEKTTYGINIRIFHSRLLIWHPSVGTVASLAKSLFFFHRPPPSSQSVRIGSGQNDSMDTEKHPLAPTVPRRTCGPFFSDLRELSV